MGAPPKPGEERFRAPGEKTEKQKMLGGEGYLPSDPELWMERVRVRKLLRSFNQGIEYDDDKSRSIVLGQLLGSTSPEAPPFIEPPFYCDYGYNIHLGKGFYCNFNCTILDCGPVHIGDRVMFGPNVHIYAVEHPLDPVQRGTGVEFTKPVRIGNDVWVGGGAIILPGVTIGDGVTVAAGAVVTRDVEPHTVVAGNPAAVVKRLDPPPAK